MAVCPEEFRVLSLCSGIGGLELGLELVEPNLRSICHVEIEAYAAATLVNRMEEGVLAKSPIWNDVKTFDGGPWRGRVHCITGGYPCTSFSVAGKQLGEADPRHLWPDFKRIIEEVRPQACFFENVAQHLSNGFETVVSDLEQMGFRVACGVFPAMEARAGHERKRLFILAHGNSFRGPGRRETSDMACPASLAKGSPLQWQWSRVTSHHCGRDADGTPLFPVSRGDSEGWQRLLASRPDLSPALTEEEACRLIYGMADGPATRVDRLRACGNAVVPLAVAYAYCVLRDVLESTIDSQ